MSHDIYQGGFRSRSYLELKLNLPFMWIDAAARDEFVKENLVRAIVQRNDLKVLAASEVAA